MQILKSLEKRIVGVNENTNAYWLLPTLIIITGGITELENYNIIQQIRFQSFHIYPNINLKILNLSDVSKKCEWLNTLNTSKFAKNKLSGRPSTLTKDAKNIRVQMERSPRKSVRKLSFQSFTLYSLDKPKTFPLLSQAEQKIKLKLYSYKFPNSSRSII